MSVLRKWASDRGLSVVMPFESPQSIRGMLVKAP